MKTRIIIILIILTGCICLLANTNFNKYERNNCQVVRVTEQGSTINDGINLWKTADILTYGEKVDLIMHDNGSPDYIYDDYIISIKVVE